MFFASSQTRPADITSGCFLAGVNRPAVRPLGTTLRQQNGPYNSASVESIAWVGATTTSAHPRPRLTSARYLSQQAGACFRLTAAHQERTQECPTTTTGVLQGSAP